MANKTLNSTECYKMTSEMLPPCLVLPDKSLQASRFLCVVFFDAVCLALVLGLSHLIYIDTDDESGSLDFSLDLAKILTHKFYRLP